MTLHTSISRFLLTALIASGSTSVAGQNHATLVPESRLWIEGTSTVNSFTCEADSIEGDALFHESSDRKAQAEVRVAVEEFDCGKNRMNRDFKEALKADSHPLIRFNLIDLQSDSSSDTAGFDGLRVRGAMQIAGTRREVTVLVDGEQQADGTWRASGSLDLLMSDFGIDPPTALFGLIQAHDSIRVGFDLIALTYPTITTN